MSDFAGIDCKTSDFTGIDYKTTITGIDYKMLDLSYLNLILHYGIDYKMSDFYFNSAQIKKYFTFKSTAYIALYLFPISVKHISIQYLLY